MAGLRICMKGTSLRWIKDDSTIGGHLNNLQLWSPFNVYIQPLTDVASNVSVFIDQAYGELNRTTGLYNGCLGRLQRNESDVVTFDVPWPQPSHHFTLSGVVQSSKTAFWSMYDPRSGTAGLVDIMSAFRGFDYITWLLIAAFFYIATMVSTLTSLVHRRPLLPGEAETVTGPRIVWERVKKHSISEMLGPSVESVTSKKIVSDFNHSIAMTMIAITSLVFIFFMRFFFATTIKTEAVVHKKPITIESYDDILARDDVRPYFSPASNCYLDFKNAESGSKESLIWMKAGRVNPDEPLDEHGAMKGKVVQIDLEPFARFDAALVCMYMPYNGRLPLVRSGAKNEQMSAILRSSFLHPVTGQALDRKFMRLIEIGAHKLWLRQIFHMAAPIVSCSSDKLGACFSMDEVVIPDKGLHPLLLRQHRGLVLLLIVVSLTSFGVLVGEHVVQRRNKIAAMPEQCVERRNTM